MIEYQDYAKRVAQQVAVTLHGIEFEDAESCAYLGLVQAASRFVPNGAAHFKTFAYTRIKGAIIDFVREQSFVSRRGIEQGVRIRLSSLEAGISDEEFIRSPLVSRPIDFDGSIDMNSALLSELTERERDVVLAIAHGAKGREVAEALGVTESRVSQIAAAGRAKLERKVAA